MWSLICRANNAGRAWRPPPLGLTRAGHLAGGIRAFPDEMLTVATVTAMQHCGHCGTLHCCGCGCRCRHRKQRLSPRRASQSGLGVATEAATTPGLYPGLADGPGARLLAAARRAPLQPKPIRQPRPCQYSGMVHAREKLNCTGATPAPSADSTPCGVTTSTNSAAMMACSRACT